MYKLPNLDLDKHYRTEFISASYDYQHDLKNLLERIERESNPINFWNQLYAITRLFYDGLLCNGFLDFYKRQFRKLELWSDQKEVLDKLVECGKIAIGQFYRGDGIDSGKLREIFLPFSDRILKHGVNSKAPSRKLDITYNDVQKFGLALQENLNDRISTPTSEICIASGGFEPSYLALNLIDREELTIARYSRIKKADKKVLTPKNAPEDYLDSAVKGKIVLVCEDSIGRGNTIQKLLQEIIKSKPTGLYGAVVSTNKNPFVGFDIGVINGQDPFIFEVKQ